MQRQTALCVHKTTKNCVPIGSLRFFSGNLESRNLVAAAAAAPSVTQFVFLRLAAD